MKKQRNKFIQGAFILTLAGIVSKILSAFYRIPIQNLTGDLGFYFYQQIYPMIAFMMILALYSFPAAISKMGAQIGIQRYSLRYFIIPNAIILFCIQFALALLIYIAAPHLANLVGDSRLADGYVVVAFSLLFVPLLALIRGLYQASGEMEVTAISQVIEQIVRVGLIVFIAMMIAIGNMDIGAIAPYGVLASALGMIVATIYALSKYIHSRKNGVEIENSLPSEIPYGYYIKTLIFFGFAVALNHMMFIIVQLADVLTVVPLLEKYGLTIQEAIKWKGVFDRAVPLIQLGMVIGSSFALALIPYIANAKQEKEEKKETIQEAIAISMYIAGGAVVGLFILYPETNMLLFKDLNGLLSMRVFIISIVLLAFLMTINAILQSYGHIFRTASYVGLLFMIKIGLNLIFIPKLGLLGAALASLVSLFILCIVTARYFKRKFRHLALFAQLKKKAYLMSLLTMSLVLLMMKWLVPMPVLRPYLMVYVLTLVTLGAVVYFIMLLRHDALTDKQLQTLPLGHIWLQLEKRIGKKN